VCGVIGPLYQSSYSITRRGSRTAAINLLGTVINGASLCLECIEHKTGVALLEVKTALKAMARAFKLVIAVGCCHSCRRTDATFNVTGLIN
jgi:hypothetical protein